MEKQNCAGWRRLANAAGYSVQGLKAAWFSEAAFRQELVLVLLLVPVACWLGTSMTQRAFLLFCLLVILMAELLNSAIEATVDRIGLEDHDLSGRAKNMGSAAVLVSLIAAAMVWALVAWERWGS